MLKDLIKRTIGLIMCKMYGIEAGKKCYIGVNVKVSKLGGVKMKDNVRISNDSLFLLVAPKAQIEIGNNCRLAHHLQISCASKVVVRDNVNIAPFVFISDHNHEYRDVDAPILNQGIMMGENDCALVDEGTWIGTKVTIAGNVRIGKHCVIGANSVVTKDIPDYSVAAGVPAKVIKRYNFETKRWEKAN